MDGSNKVVNESVNDFICVCVCVRDGKQVRERLKERKCVLIFCICVSGSCVCGGHMMQRGE